MIHAGVKNFPIFRWILREKNYLGPYGNNRVPLGSSENTLGSISLKTLIIQCLLFLTGNQIEALASSETDVSAKMAKNLRVVK